MPKRLALVLVSAAALAIAAASISRKLAGIEGRALGASLAALEASARGVERELAPAGVDLPELAARLAAQPGLDKDLRQLVVAQRALAKAPRPSPAQKTRVDSLRAKVVQRFAPARAGDAAVAAVALVSELGEVVYSESTRVPLGAQVGPVTMDLGGGETDASAATEGEADAAATPRAGATAAASAAAIIANAYGTAPARGAFLDHGSVFYLGAAPLVGKNKVAGIVVLERQLATLPPGAFLLAGGKVVLGSAPAGFEAPRSVPDRPFVLAARPASRRPWFEATLAEAAVATGSPAGAVQPGLWAARFRVPTVEGVHGFVTSELSAGYAEAADAQRTVLVGVAVLWLLHALMILGIGMRAERATARLASAFAAAPRAGSRPALDERGYPRELRALVSGIKAILSPAAPAGGPAAAATLPPLGAARPAGAPPTSAAERPSARAPVAGAPLGAADASSEAEATPSPSDAAPPAATPEATTDDPAASTPPHAGRLDLAGDASTAGASAAVTEPAVPLAAPGPGDAATRRAAELFGLSLDEAAAPAAGAPPPLTMPPAVVQPEATPVDSSFAATPPAAPEPGDAPAGADGPAEHAYAASAGAGATTPDDAAPAPDAEAVFSLAREVAERPLDRGPALADPTPEALEPSEAGPALAAPLLTPIGGEPAQSVRALYDEFVEARRGCGETGELTFEKFRGRLEESRTAVMARHHCNGVRFQVYVKNGRAAIKATPA